MLDLFLGLRRLLKRRIIHIENTVFRLHWQMTSVTLMAFSLIITARQYVGSPIDCIQKDDIPENVLNTFCWIHSTFTIPAAFEKTVGKEVPYPGVDNSFYEESDKKYLTYYQWVCFSLFLQGLFFYAPYYLWKNSEGGLMRALSMGMQIAIISDAEKGHRKRILLDYLQNHFGKHRIYAIKYFFCEILCLLNLLLQMTFMDWFFDGQFWTFGFDVLCYVRGGRKINPMLFVFPRMTKCIFHSYGYSGDVQMHDALCMLPLNVVNEKIYVFIWFWFAFLFLLTIGVITYRLSILFVPKLRANCLFTRCRLSSRRDLETICNAGNVGDWFVLYMLGYNLDPIVMAEVTSDMAKRISVALLDKNKKNREPSTSILIGNDEENPFRMPSTDAEVVSPLM